MTTDLWILVATALWTLLLVFPRSIFMLRSPGGLAWGLGNRSSEFPEPEWAGRAQRAHANMVENLGPFALLVLVAHIAGVANEVTATACIVFLACRVAHAVTYIAGITVVRTIVWAGGLGAEGVIAAQFLG